MELRQLRYFVKVAETLHFGRAAEQLHIAQQPLSFQIRQLEDELGVKLFERTTRSVVLTPAGEAMLKEVRGGLTRIERGVDLARLITNGEYGNVIIGYNPQTLLTIMPQIIRQFRKRFPQIEVVLVELHPYDVERQILSEDLDIGIVSSLGPKLGGLSFESIFQDYAAVALPKNHPLAQKEMISLGELKSEPFVMYARMEHPELFDQIIALCRLSGFSPIIAQEAASESAIVSLVAAGLGVALVASSLSRLRSTEVIYRPLIEPLLTLDVALMWKANKELPWLEELRQIAQGTKPGTILEEESL